MNLYTGSGYQTRALLHKHNYKYILKLFENNIKFESVRIVEMIIVFIIIAVFACNIYITILHTHIMVYMYDFNGH